MMRTCLNIVTCNTWLVLFFFFCEVLFSMLNTVTLFCMCLCFCKNHIYFTIFVDKKKKKPIWFWLYFSIWIGLLYDLFTPPPPPPPVLIMSKRSVQRQENHVISNATSKFWYTVDSYFDTLDTFHLKEGKHEGFIIFLEDTWDSPLSHRGPGCLSS